MDYIYALIEYLNTTALFVWQYLLVAVPLYWLLALYFMVSAACAMLGYARDATWALRDTCLTLLFGTPMLLIGALIAAYNIRRIKDAGNAVRAQYDACAAGTCDCTDTCVLDK